MYNETAERIHFFLIILFFTIKRCGLFTPPTGVRIPMQHYDRGLRYQWRTDPHRGLFYLIGIID
jgi:hypothetical protein